MIKSHFLSNFAGLGLGFPFVSRSCHEDYRDLSEGELGTGPVPKMVSFIRQMFLSSYCVPGMGLGAGKVMMKEKTKGVHS